MLADMAHRSALLLLLLGLTGECAALCLVTAALAVTSSTAQRHAHTRALFAGHALAADATAGQKPSSDASLSTGLSSAAGKSSSSACAKQCFQQAKTLGFERVAGDSLACFMPYKGKKLSTYDCCDKVSKPTDCPAASC
jgi:hypothetical protein